MSYNCRVEERSTQAVLSIRTRTRVEELPQELGKAYGAIAQYLCELQEQPAGAPFAAYYNMDMQNLDVEIGFPVPHPLPGRGEVQSSEIPGGKAATCLHIGPYDQMEPAYTALSEWMQENGYEAAGVAYEMYLSDPQDTPPEELKTQIVFPLKST